MNKSANLAELMPEEIEVIQELEQALSHVKERHIVLIAFDMGEYEENGEPNTTLSGDEDGENTTS